MRIAAACLAIASVIAPPVEAQTKPPTTYRLRFRLQESGVEAKTPTRNYVLIVQGKSRGKINASHRLPYYSSSKGEAKELHTIALGSIIECRPDDDEGGVRLDCAFESSYVASAQPPKSPPIGFLPPIDSRQVSTSAIIPIGPEVQLAALDDPASNNRLEIFVSAERFAGPAASKQ